MYVCNTKLLTQLCSPGAHVLAILYNLLKTKKYPYPDVCI